MYTETQKSRLLSVTQLLQTQLELNNNLKIGPDWIRALTVDHYYTAIIGELGEILDQPTSPQYKWWKAKSPESYSELMTKLEIIDIVHFYLSINLIRVHDFSENQEEFERRINSENDVYVGMDLTTPKLDIHLIQNGHELNHRNYMYLVRRILDDSEHWIYVLDHLVCSMGISREELSAIYTAKATLNKVRWEHPDWQKVNKDGLEDNERMFPVINKFLSTPDMTLVELKGQILEEFYGQS